MGVIGTLAQIQSGDTDDPTRDMSNWNAIRDVVNGNIDNDNVATAAAIASSKLALTNITNIENNNNVPYEIENAAGTAKPLLNLGADDVFRLGQLTRQGGSATAWNSSGTTDYTANSWTIQAGRIDVATATEVTVTFPTAFDDSPLVVATCGTTTNTFNCVVSNITLTAVKFKHDGGGTSAVNWIAIGPLA